MWGITLLNTGGLFERSAAIFFLLITLMFAVNLKEIEPSKFILTVFNFTNVTIIFLGFMMILKNWTVGAFMISYYSDFYPELLINMVDRGKPVVSFATHSVAGFYMFLLFYLNYKTYYAANTRLNLLFAYVYLYFCFVIQSNTSLILLVFGVILLFVKIENKFMFLLKWTLPLVALILYFFEEIKMFWMEVQFAYWQTSNSSDNGFLGRYANGVQSDNIQRILENPFSGIGFAGGNSDLVLFDSGIIVLALRGTVLLVIVFYLAFMLYIKKNLRDTKTALFIGFIFIAFEFGFNNLLYFRTIMMLPFILILLNYLEGLKMNNIYTVKQSASQ